jgi:hypothetical protein
MNLTIFDYNDEDFAARARRLITNGQSFAFDVNGAARVQLEAYVQNGRISDPVRLGVKPKLQALLAILMLAEAQGQAVSLDVNDKHIRVWIGVVKA